MTLHAYRVAMLALSPLAPLVLRRRAARGKEERPRLRERLGWASIARPPGRLVWIHGASVGESLAALPLCEALANSPGRTVLFTSGTVTSARLLSERLPHGAIHQYAPLDIPGAVARFLDHWQPDAALFVDSEIWPNLIAAAHARGTKLALINGRISKKSFLGWQRAPRMAAAIFSLYDICLAQDAESAERLRLLGARNVELTGSLKADALPPPADAAKMADLSRALAGRPVLLAASTHPGEETELLAAHDLLRSDFPDLLTIIVPRHPERGGEIATLCRLRSAARRSADHEPSPDTEIYIADTLGELGLFFRLAPFAFMGGSLIPHGGQNPLEAAKLGRAVSSGPYTDNFAEAYNAIFAAQACGRVGTAADIAAIAGRLFRDAAEAGRLGETAKRAAETLGGALEKTRAAVEGLLSHARA